MFVFCTVTNDPRGLPGHAKHVRFTIPPVRSTRRNKRRLLRLLRQETADETEEGL